MSLAARAGAVGIDPWRVLEACALSVDERIIAERLVEMAEANEIAKVAALADQIAARGIETYAEFLLAIQRAQAGG